jgi:phenylpyruvate tautomerase PptA (4-oxalocrotonate tautomerase family)
MPLVRVTMVKGKSPEYIEALSQSIYKALVGSYQMPENDMFQIIEQLEPGSLIYDRNFGVKKSRSDDFIFVNIESDARRREEKEAFLQALSNNLVVSPGIAPQDVFVRLSVNSAQEDWSFGDGLPASKMFAEAG